MARLIAGRTGPIALGAILLLCGCNDDPNSPENQKFAAMADAEHAVRLSLRDPDSARFDGEQVFAAADGHTIVCGYVNAKNGFGGLTGEQRFVWTSGDLLGRGAALDESDRAVVDLLWAKSCGLASAG